MQRAALVVLPECSLHDVSHVLTTIRQNDWRLRTLSLDGQPVTTSEGIVVRVDGSLAASVPRDVNLCILPGGDFTPQIFGNLGLHRFLRQYDGSRGWFAASEEGVVCLASAGIMGGVAYSASAAVTDAFSSLLRHAIRREEPVSVDANVISSDGSDSYLFAKTLMDYVNLQS